MAADVVQSDYERLGQVAKQFQKLHDQQTQMEAMVHQTYQQLRSTWQGDAAVAFFGEMDDSIFPTLKRLQTSLTTASAMTTQISQIFRQAEEEAAKGIKFDGGGVTKGSQTKVMSFAQTEAGATPTPTPPIPPLTPEQQATLDKVNGMIEMARNLGYSMAPKHLEHWLNGSGDPLIYPAADFKDLPSVRAGLRETFERFQERIEQKGANGDIPLGRSNRVWDDGFYFDMFGDPEQFYGFGGIRVHYEAEIEVIDTPEGKKVIFHSINTNLYDDYNWDEGKSTYVPGVGIVDDAEMRTLEQPNGPAKEYQIRTETWSETEESITGKAAPNQSNPPSGR